MAAASGKYRRIESRFADPAISIQDRPVNGIDQHTMLRCNVADTQRNADIQRNAHIQHA